MNLLLAITTDDLLFIIIAEKQNLKNKRKKPKIRIKSRRYRFKHESNQITNAHGL
jgi:hypothetical protein